MSGCCDTRGYERLFDHAMARRDAERYRRRGLDGTARDLFGFLADRVRGSTILEAGGGVGDLTLELLQAGAAHATSIEIAGTYEAEAQSLLAERGLAGRVIRHVGDFASTPGGPADVVVLNRVVCCYPDARAIVGEAARRARRYVALALPRDDAWLRFGAMLVNLGAALRYPGWAFRVHPLAVVREELTAAGFREVAARGGLVWRSSLWER